MCSMSSQVAKKNTAINHDIIEKLQSMADLYSKTNGTTDVRFFLSNEKNVSA